MAVWMRDKACKKLNKSGNTLTFWTENLASVEIVCVTPLWDRRDGWTSAAPQSGLVHSQPCGINPRPAPTHCDAVTSTLGRVSINRKEMGHSKAARDTALTSNSQHSSMGSAGIHGSENWSLARPNSRTKQYFLFMCPPLKFPQSYKYSKIMR